MGTVLYKANIASLCDNWIDDENNDFGNFKPKKQNGFDHDISDEIYFINHDFWLTIE